MKFAGMLAVFLISAISLCAQGSGADGSSAQNAWSEIGRCPAGRELSRGVKVSVSEGRESRKGQSEGAEGWEGQKVRANKKSKGFCK